MYFDLKFHVYVPEGPIESRPELVHVMALYNKLLSDVLKWRHCATIS